MGRNIPKTHFLFLKDQHKELVEEKEESPPQEDLDIPGCYLEGGGVSEAVFWRPTFSEDRSETARRLAIERAVAFLRGC